jgi:LpxI C-terminal domain
MRFDVPVIGVETIRIAAESGVRVIAIEAGKTLLLERDAVAKAWRILSTRMEMKGFFQSRCSQTRRF